MSIRSCETISAFTGIARLYLMRCGEVIPSCGINFSFEPDTEETEIECNGKVRRQTSFTGFTVTMSMNFNIHALSSILDVPLIPIISSNGIPGVGLPLPIGTLPSGIGFAAVSRSDTEELHVRGINANLTGITITEFSRGNVVTVEVTVSTTDLELLQYAGLFVPVASSSVLVTTSPFYTWFLCDCEEGDTVNHLWGDQNVEHPLHFGNSPELVVKSASGCCGWVLTPKSGYKTDLTGLIDSDGNPATSWGAIVQADLDSGAPTVIMDAGPLLNVTYDGTGLLTITNPTGSVVYPYLGGPIVVGYSNDGTVIVNGTSLTGLGPDPAVPTGMSFFNPTAGGIAYSINVYNRFIGLADVA